jgi:hypothetical protein
MMHRRLWSGKIEANNVRGSIEIQISDGLGKTSPVQQPKPKQQYLLGRRKHATTRSNIDGIDFSNQNISGFALEYFLVFSIN